MARVGLLFTVSMVMLATLVFSLGAILFANYMTTENRARELAMADKLYRLDSSVQLGIRDIFYASSGMNIVAGANSITFYERMPYANNFAAELGNFKDFVEARSDVVIDTSKAAELPLVIMPHNITLTHDYSINKTTVTPLTTNFNGYVVNITTSEVITPSSCTGNTKPGETLDLVVYATGSSGSCSSTKERVVVKNADNKDIAVIEITSNKLEVTAFFDVTTWIGVVSMANLGQTTVVYPDVIQVSLNEFGMSKKSSARLL